MDHLTFLRSLRDRKDKEDSVTGSHRGKIIDACIDIETPQTQPGLQTKAFRRLKNLQRSKERVSDAILKQYLTPVNYDAYQLLRCQERTKKSSSSRQKQRENRKKHSKDKPKGVSMGCTIRYFIGLFEGDKRAVDDELLRPDIDPPNYHDGIFLVSGLIWEAEFLAREVDCMPFGSLAELEQFRLNQVSRLHRYREHLENASHLKGGEVSKPLSTRVAKAFKQEVFRASGPCSVHTPAARATKRCWSCIVDYIRFCLLLNVSPPPRDASLLLAPVVYGYAVCSGMVCILESLLGRISGRLDQLRLVQEHYQQGCSALSLRLKENKMARKMDLPEWEPTSVSALSWPHRVTQKLELTAEGSSVRRYVGSGLEGLKEEAGRIRGLLRGEDPEEVEAE